MKTKTPTLKKKKRFWLYLAQQLLYSEIAFSLSDEIKTQKMNTQESKERKFEEKVRKKGCVFLNIYVVVFPCCYN